MHRHALLPVILLAGSLSAQTVSYQRSGNNWIRSEGDHTYRVDPSVITIRTDLDRDVAGILEALQGELAGARMLRENRLGFRDIEIPTGGDVMDFVTQLRNTGLFELVEENTIGRYGVVGGPPTDPMFGSQWNLHNTGQTGGSSDADVDALEAWDIEDGDPSIVVAVADSGTNWNHEDLIGNIWSNPGETLNGMDSDSNGYVDDVRGWDFDFNDNDPNGSFWHGTSVASVVASRGGNGVGLVGLAGGGQDGTGCKVMPLNVGSAFPNSSILDDAILYAADNGAHIITMSLSIGTSAPVEAAIDAADAAGLFIDCAAGNGGFSVSYPASLPKVMAIASTNHNDSISSFSNQGPEVEVAAPGEDIPMCELGNTSYHSNSGTSFSSPHVAALAALIMAVDPSLTAAEVRQHIRDTADDVGAPGPDNQAGDGRINAHQALSDLDGARIEIYGAGTVGTDGIPQIGTTALPVINTTFDITVSSARAGAPGILGSSPAFGNYPIFGGKLHIEPAGMLLFVTTIDGSGDGALTFTIPNNPALIGAERYCQWFIVDVEASQGVAMSSGLYLRAGE